MIAAIRVWNCGNCGHEVPIPDDGSVGELKFEWLGDRISKISCPACRSYTIQKATDDSFTAGEFLIVKTKNAIKGKGK